MEVTQGLGKKAWTPRLSQLFPKSHRLYTGPCLKDSRRFRFFRSLFLEFSFCFLGCEDAVIGGFGSAGVQMVLLGICRPWVEAHRDLGLLSSESHSKHGSIVRVVEKSCSLIIIPESTLG